MQREYQRMDQSLQELIQIKINMNLKYPDSYVVWDLETTGLDPKTCKIVEVAALIVKNGEVADEYTAILNHDVDIPEQASAVHGITREKAKAEGIDPKKAIETLVEILMENDASVTHNGHNFDIPFLVYALMAIKGDEHGDIPKIENHLYTNGIDTAVLVKAKKLNMQRKWNETFYNFGRRVMGTFAKGVYFNIKQCCIDFDIDQSKVTLHRAGGDVEMTNEIYKKITA